MADERYRNQIWCYCRQCGFGGDILELYAAASKFPAATPRDRLSAAFARLSDLGLIVHPEQSPLETCIWTSERRQLNRDMWKRAVSEGPELLKTDQVLRGIVGMMGLTYQSSSWAERTGKILGVTSQDRFNEAISWTGGSVIKTKYDELKHIHMGRRPRDGSVHHLVIFPFWEVPGVIGGWSVTVRVKGEDALLTVFRKVNRSSHLGGGVWNVREHAGFAFLDRLPEIDSELGTAVSIFTNPLDALTVHDRALQESSKPLPALAMPSGTSLPPVFRGDLVAGRKVTILTQQMDAAALTAAVDSRSQVAVYGDHKKLNQLVFKTSARQALHRLSLRAIPWHEALSSAIMERGSSEANFLISSMRLTERDLEDVFDHISPEARDRLRASHLAKKVSPNSITTRTVYEDNGRWWNVTSSKRSTLIADAILRIDEIRRFQKPQPHSVARGRILFDGKTFPFEENFAVIEEKGFIWMRDLLLDQGAGLMNFSSKHADRDLVVTVALRFQKAIQMPGADDLGWNRELNGFSLPQCLIKRNGSLGDSAMSPLRGITIETEHVRRLQRTPCDDPGVIRAMSQPEASHLWAVAVAVIHEVIGTLMIRNPAKFEFRGESLTGVFSFRDAAQHIGCSIIRSTAEIFSNWPCLWNNYVTTSRQTDAQDVYRLYSWASAPKEAIRFLKGITIPFLMWWLSKHPGMLQLRPGLEQLASLLAEWFQNMGGDPGIVKDGGELWQLVTA